MRSTLLLPVVVPVVGACLLLASLTRGAANTIDVTEIKPGMKGYGLTVFRGETPERFDVEVIDVLKNFRPDQDLILVRTPHPVLDKAIVVGGMSGSPVYLDGRLAGAYAYGWLFGKEPVAGVTPIANMLTELVRPVDPAVWDALGVPLLSGTRRGKAASGRLVAAPARTALPSYAHAQEAGGGALGPLRAHAQALGFAGGAAQERVRVTPASTPLMLSGFDPRVVDVLDRELSPFGMPAVEASAGGGARKSGAPPRFVDGGAIGVQLIRGDLQATSIGTVTHVAGKRLIAFGHPMMNAGQPALPTATARILHVLANDRRSFKIGEVQTPLGAMIHDRQAAIVIDTSLTPQTVPMTVRVHGVSGAPRTEWNMELASHRLLTPMLAFSALLNALSATVAEQTDAVFEAKSRVKIAGHGEHLVTDFGYAPGGVGSPMAAGQLRAFDLAGVAYVNPWEQARVERIDVDLHVRFGRDVIMVLEAVAPASTVDPGRDAQIYVTLRRFGQPDETRMVTVPIPMSAAGEKIEIALEPGNQVKLEQPKPDDLDQLLANIKRGYPATSLVVSTKLPTLGVSMRGHVVHNVPGSLLDTLQLSGGSDAPTTFATQARSELPMGAVVFGSARVKLEVRAEPLN